MQELIELFDCVWDSVEAAGELAKRPEGSLPTLRPTAAPRVIRPTEQHWTTFQLMLKDGQAFANLVTDAHLAVLAVEHGCDLATTDSDFARFPKLKWINPLSL